MVKDWYGMVYLIDTSPYIPLFRYHSEKYTPGNLDEQLILPSCEVGSDDKKKEVYRSQRGRAWS